MKIEDIYGDLPSLETDRLILRKLTLEDATDVFEYAREPDVARYLTWEPHRSIDDSKGFLNFMIERYKDNQVSDWGIVLKENNKLIGTVGFIRWSPDNFRAEVGYALSKEYWGQGMMTEAVKEIMKFGFDKMELNRIEGRTWIENIGSQAVLKKAGMTFEGTMREQIFLKGKYVDHTLYSILKKEYV